jgi:hypothetical protein
MPLRVYRASGAPLSRTLKEQFVDQPPIQNPETSHPPDHGHVGGSLARIMVCHYVSYMSQDCVFGRARTE